MTYAGAAGDTRNQMERVLGFDALHKRVHPAVTVQTCGDLPTIRPIVEGQPSTVFPLPTVSVPSNVNSYMNTGKMDAGYRERDCHTKEAGCFVDANLLIGLLDFHRPIQ